MEHLCWAIEWPELQLVNPTKKLYCIKKGGKDGQGVALKTNDSNTHFIPSVNNIPLRETWMRRSFLILNDLIPHLHSHENFFFHHQHQLKCCFFDVAFSTRQTKWQMRVNEKQTILFAICFYHVYTNFAQNHAEREWRPPKKIRLIFS